MKTILPLLAALAIAGTVRTQAATVSYSYGMPVTETTTELDETATLGLFDSSLGTLTGAQLQITGTSTMTITLTNGSDGTVSGSADGRSRLNFRSNLSALDAYLAPGNPQLTLEVGTGASLSYAPGQSRTFGPTQDVETRNYDLSSILASLKAPGGGNFTITAKSLSGIGISGGGGQISFDQTTTAGAGMTITYTYTPVPEPAAVSLLALGAALPLMRRRR